MTWLQARPLLLGTGLGPAGIEEPKEEGCQLILENEDAIVGCILGTAVGDALGLPYEGLSPQRSLRLYRNLDRYHFFFGHGMVSDDTEHTCMVALALISSGADASKFKSSLSWNMRLWLLYLPAGVGFATLRAILKLWLGFPPERSGVPSAGNGPAMRSAIIGVSYGDDRYKMRDLIKISTKITHTDPKAEWGALAVAVAAHMASEGRHVTACDYHNRLIILLEEDKAGDFLALIERTTTSVEAKETTQSFAATLNLKHGVTGYVYHTVPVVIHAWLRNQDNYKNAIMEIIRCGGDTDTTAAILGGIVGAGVGGKGIPKLLLDGLWEWPGNISWMENLGRELAQAKSGGATRAPRLPVSGVLIRNILFLVIVLFHGFKRLFPPY